MAACLFCLVCLRWRTQNRQLPLDKIKLPAGFSIELWAEVPNARELALGKKARFSPARSEGQEFTPSRTTDGKRQVRTIARGLNLPIGVAFREGALYVSSVDRILRFDDIEEKLDQPGKPYVVTERFPSEKHHGGKFIAFGPMACCMCRSAHPAIFANRPEKFCMISRIKPDGTNYEVFA